MKNVLKIIALSGLFASGVFAAASASSSWFNEADLSVKGSVGFESEYLYRGNVLAMDTIVTSVEGAYKLYNGSLYAGVLNHDSASTAFSESDFYVGYKMPVWDKFSADVGYTYYWYQQNPTVAGGPVNTPDRRNEIYAGVVYNGLYVNPAAYIYYDFNSDAVIGELSGKYSWDLAKYGWANTALDVGAFVGGVASDDELADQDGAGKAPAGYAYYGASADLVYSFNKNASASVGLTWGGKSNAGGTAPGAASVLYPEKDSLFWGTKFSAGF